MKSFEKFVLIEGIAMLQNLGTIEKYVRAKRLGEFKQGIDILNNALEKGEIYNPDFEDVRKWKVGRQVEDATTALRDKYREFSRTKPYDRDDNVTWLSSYVVHAPGNVKKLANSIKKYGEDEYLQELAKFWGEAAQIAEVFKKLKPMVIKGRKPDPNAKPKFRPKFNPQYTKMIEEKFREITKALYDRTFAFYVKDYTRIVREFEARLASGKFTTISKEYRVKPFSRNVLYRVVKNLDQTPLELKSDWLDIITKLAKEDTENYFMQYIAKNVQKLSAIVGAKGNLKEIKVIKMDGTNGTIWSQIYFTFADGASFLTVNKSVTSVSKYGKWFYRFPTTFHNVTKADGKKLKSPSEEKMNKEFV